MIPVLFIDDDAELAELLAEYLEQEGFAVTHLADGRRCLAALSDTQPEIVVLDIMMPGISGIEVLRRIRRESAVPVLMLTARGDEVDRIAGLDLGADDYLAKPCSPGELAARCRAILRRAGGRTAVGSQPLTAGMLVVDATARTARWHGLPLDLTGAEFSLLEVLAANAGRIMSRAELSEQGLGRPLAPYDRSVDVHVSSIRQKLFAARRGPSSILSVRGHGYQLVPT
ncbi:DNA-binding response regulator [Cereibacter changlensis JA139]|uniref:DNA-binding response regulator n=2 Tax=Cereibacter changlensis TaxID=402884 RepID=A0A2T4JP71_9RHOB|nr:DNA-binding response regulator [Cereibacter changlensis JA139]PZX47725.1 two-component system OmpR family response regulator/two-component system response regulator CpxR [Cereibacter changlensis]